MGYAVLFATLRALNPSGGVEMDVEDIVGKVMELTKYKRISDHITVTGGSPLECNRKELIYLLELLKLDGYWITLEESGQVYCKNIFDVCDFLSIDAKSPSTGVKINYKVHNLLYNNYLDKTQIKIIVRDEKDLEFVEEYLERYSVFSRIERLYEVIVTPCWEIRESFRTFRSRTKWIHREVLKRGLSVRVIPQLHKIIYGTKRVSV